MHRPITRLLLLAAPCLLGVACSGAVDDGTTPDAGTTATPPDTTITAGPDGTTSETGATFTFTCSGTACTFECALDDAAFAACESPKVLTDVPLGAHTFKVRASTAAGADATPATRAWTVEAPPPDTTVTGGPEGTTHLIAASFTLGCDKGSCTYECALDAAAFAACTSPVAFDDVADGEHTFKARATAAGKTDATPASHTWTINTLRQPRKWIDRAGNIYVADTSNCVVRKITAKDGKISTYAGTHENCSTSSGDGGPATSAVLRYPIAVAVGPTGDLFILEDADAIRKVDHATGVITTLVGRGSEGLIAEGGAPTSGRLDSTYTFFVSSAGDVYLGEDNRVRVLRAATGVVTTVASSKAEGCGTPTTGAVATSVCFEYSLFGVAEGLGGAFYAATRARIYRVESSGTLTVVAGSASAALGFGGNGGPALDAQFSFPCGLAVAANGDLVIADTNNSAVRKIKIADGTIAAFAGTGTQGSTGDGAAASEATLSRPGDVAFDPAGDLFIADSYNHTVRKVDHVTGVISRVAGNYTQGFSGDGASATEAQLNQPAGFFNWWD